MQAEIILPEAEPEWEWVRGRVYHDAAHESKPRKAREATESNAQR